MYQSIVCLLTGLFVPASFLVISSAIAHQHLTIENVNITAHLEPDDSPYAGEPSFTWFHLTRADGEEISLADCTCSLVVYDSQYQVISYPDLSESDVEGHERPITTSITFPSAGTYQLTFIGQPTENQFDPFELNIPVTVRP